MRILGWISLILGGLLELFFLTAYWAGLGAPPASTHAIGLFMIVMGLQLRTVGRPGRLRTSRAAVSRNAEQLSESASHADETSTTTEMPTVAMLMPPTVTAALAAYLRTAGLLTVDREVTPRS